MDGHNTSFIWVTTAAPKLKYFSFKSFVLWWTINLAILQSVSEWVRNLLGVEVQSAEARTPYSKQAAAAGESSHPRSGESRIDRMNGGEGEVIHARYDVIQG